MKRISWLVISVHLFFLFWGALWLPSKKKIKKPLQIRTVVYHPPSPPKQQILTKAPIQQIQNSPVPVKKTVPKKPMAKKTISSSTPKKIPVKKPPSIPENLKQQLQESIAKIEQKSHKESPKKALEVPNWIPHLKIDEGIEADESVFAQALVECLQNALNLPEVGAVKIELTLRYNGSFIRMRVLESKSERNQVFLEEELQTLKFPSFSGSLKNEKEHAFVITFCNS